MGGGDDADDGGGGDGAADSWFTLREDEGTDGLGRTDGRCTGSVLENHHGMAGLRSTECGVAASGTLLDILLTKEDIARLES